MNIHDIEKINSYFATCMTGNADNVIECKAGKGNIPVVEIKNKYASALISLQGAHVLSWVPKGEAEVIWVSADASFAEGKSVRGGIPICWPWFGAHESNSEFPAHGFARTVYWDVGNARQLETGETQITFKLNTKQASEKIKAMWPQDTEVEYIVTVGADLKLELVTRNNSSGDLKITEALHTYFNVADVERTCVDGLDGKIYLDKPDGFTRKTQNGLVNIKGEVDRVYLNTGDELIINDSCRKIIINKQGSESTIVWNPGKQVAEKMGDLGEDGYLKMLCVESGNAAENVVCVAAGESHVLQVAYEIDKIIAPMYSAYS